jgi:starch phosphorylase
VGRATKELFDEVLGSGWPEGDVAAWAAAKNIGDDDFDALRRNGAERLAGLVGRHGIELDPDALIVGFARRFAPYKRANLVLKERERLEAMLADNDRPIHFLFAGKAHPHNETAKALVAEILHFGATPAAHGRFSFIPDYDMAVASYLVQGCDIWLNNPVRPREASGTSGQKVTLNGGLNCSVLDGWWAEMFDGDNGWAIPASNETSPEARDVVDAAAVIDTLTVARDEYFTDLGTFRDRTRHAWVTLGPRVTAARMVTDYNNQLYIPAGAGRTLT